MSGTSCIIPSCIYEKFTAQHFYMLPLRGITQTALLQCLRWTLPNSSLTMAPVVLCSRERESCLCGALNTNEPQYNIPCVIEICNKLLFYPLLSVGNVIYLKRQSNFACQEEIIMQLLQVSPLTYYVMCTCMEMTAEW